MGLDYGFDIFCHRDNLWEFIDSVVELDSSNSDHSATFIFGGEQKVVPLYLSGESSTYSLDSPENDNGICLTFPFIVDEAIRQYLVETEEALQKQNPEYIKQELKIDDQNRACIGCIYFYIVTDQNAIGRTGFDEGLIGFEFRAATNSMSRLFQKSESVQRTFIALSKRHNAVYCLFSSGGSEQARVLWLDGQEYSVRIHDDWLPMSEVRQIVSSSKQR
jgi:hypothetical protein